MQDRVGAADCSSSYVITINDRLDALSSSPPSHTIFKVHELLRRENAMAYEPEILAIGPYHRGKERLKAMEVWKLRGLKSILDLQKEKDATKYVEAMKRLEGRARECYSESIIFRNTDEFAEMLLLDGCFIIQFLLSVTGCHKHDTMINHRFLEVLWLKSSLCGDMLLLENQIPLFVLEELYNLTELSKYDTHHFLNIAQVFVGAAFNMFTSIPFPPKTSLSNVKDVDHLLGLLHRLFCPPVINLEEQDSPSNSVINLEEQDTPSNSVINLEAQDSPCNSVINLEAQDSPSNSVINLEAQDSPSNSFINLEAQDSPSNSVDDNGTRKLQTKSSIKVLAEKLRSLSCGMLLDDDDVVNEWDSEIIPNATTLQELKIKVEKENPFKLTFVNGVMEVPFFHICDGTETAYRNLIAYEQYCQESANCCFGHHATFMDCLIDSPEDVALLRECRIISNLIGNDEAVSTMFNKLCKHITHSKKKSDYTQIYEKVNAHCRKRRHRWMAKLKRDYFNNPWSFVSFFAASTHCYPNCIFSNG